MKYSIMERDFFQQQNFERSFLFLDKIFQKALDFLRVRYYIYCKGNK